MTTPLVDRRCPSQGPCPHLDDLEKKYDAQFKGVFDAIRKLMEPPTAPTKRQIGFSAR